MAPREDLKSDSVSFEEFARLKAADRLVLQALPPDEA